MSELGRKLAEDRALRDAARTLFRSELAHVRTAVTPDALGERIANRLGAKVEAASDAAVDLAENHGGQLAAGFAAALSAAGLWLARKSVLAGFAGLMAGRNKHAGEDGDQPISEENDDE